MGVAREPEVDEHGLSVGAEDHVGGLQVEVHHLLQVDGLEGGGDGGAQPRHLAGRQRGALRPGGERLPLHQLHGQEGLGGEVASPGQARHVGTAQGGEHRALHLEAGDRLGRLAVAEPRELQHQRPGLARRRGPVELAHPARVERRLDHEAIDPRTGVEPHHPPHSSRRARLSGRPAARTLAAAEGMS